MNPRNGPVVETALQEAILRELRLRVGPEVARYVLKRAKESATEVAVMAADARTGVPLRTILDGETLRRLTGSLQRTE